MITLIEARHYRSLRYIRQPLGPFHVLVGPNASGKTTFLDVVAFLGRLVSDGVEAAVEERTLNVRDLMWQREGDSFELAIEADVPEELALDHSCGRVRYEVQVGIHPESNELAILLERVFLLRVAIEAPTFVALFPAKRQSPTTITHKAKQGWRQVIGKTLGGNDNFSPERKPKTGRAWAPSFKIGHRKSALGMVPEDASQFPICMWLKELLADGVQLFVLNSALIRKPSPPNQRRGFNTDGSNLPWVIHDLRTNHATRFGEWIAHMRTALPDIADVDVKVRNEDRHAYLRVKYGHELWVPSWMVSDGTLRMMALTLPAYIPNFRGIYLIEEPENGIHPKAIETVFQSLSSVYDAQILIASHSPIILNQAEPAQLLCFAKDESGATDVIFGGQHPQLREWQRECSLGMLLAAGVLG